MFMNRELTMKKTIEESVQSELPNSKFVVACNV